MKKLGYLALLTVLGLVPAGAAAQQPEVAENSLQEPAVESSGEPADSQSVGELSEEALEAVEEQSRDREPLPESNVVIDRLAGEVRIRENEVVRRAKLLAGELRIEGTVLEDVQMVAGEIRIPGRVEERVELMAGEVRVSGYVGPGGVDVKFGEVRVSGVVEGPVTVEFGEVRLVEGGVINGRVDVRTGDFRTVEVVSDTVNEVVREVAREGARQGSRGVAAFIGLMTLIGLAVTILIIAILFRSSIQKGVILMEKENIAWDLLWGALAVLLFVPIFVMLCVTIIGIPVAFLLLFLYPVAWLFGLILLANYLGDWILISVIKGESNFLVGTIFGIIVLGVSLAVPVFGPILMILYTFLAFGLSFRLMVGHFQNRRQEPPGPPESPEAPEATATA